MFLSPTPVEAKSMSNQWSWAPLKKYNFAEKWLLHTFTHFEAKFIYYSIIFSQIHSSFYYFIQLTLLPHICLDPSRTHILLKGSL